MKFKVKEKSKSFHNTSIGSYHSKAILKGCFFLLTSFGLLWFILVTSSEVFVDKYADKFDGMLAKMELSGKMKHQLAIRNCNISLTQRMRVAEVFDLLLQRINSKRSENYHLVFSCMETPNAFAAPNGAVIVTSGLLKTLKTDAGLAMVLAHEIAHLELKHVLKRWARESVLLVTWSLVLGDNLRNGSIDLVELVNSRANESEADDYAFELASTIIPKIEICWNFLSIWIVLKKQELI